MRIFFGFLILGLFLTSPLESIFAYSRGICSGYGRGPHVSLHVSPGRRHNRGGGDDIIFLFMLSSTSTTIYCISIADDVDDGYDTRRRRRNRYSYINYDRLKEEGARGRGEYLTALSYAIGCSAAMADEFAMSVQKNYTALFKNSAEFQSEPFMAQLDQIISENPNLRAQCASDSAGVNRF